MKFLPAFHDLGSGHVLLVGSGEPAVAKLRLLRSAGASIRWFTKNVDVAEEVAFAAGSAGRIELIIEDPAPGDFDGAIMAVSAVGSPIDEKIAFLSRAKNVPVNVVDRPDLSTFIFPAIVDRGDVVVAISTGGASPVLARRLRARIEAILPARVGEFASFVQKYRDRVATIAERSFSRRSFWERVIDGPIAMTYLSGRTRQAELALDRAVDAAHAAGHENQGIVYLVGAGPGDPDLLTLRALDALQAADLILYDDLVGIDILDRARRDATRIFVGKRKDHPGIGQDAINRQLVQAARSGKIVVRLKGGDPFIFGRGGEELEYLRNARVQTVVVPGVTSALGCAAEAGLPLTFRGEATRLCFVTAKSGEGQSPVTWTPLADDQTTVVVYMGLYSAAAVRDGLIAAGRNGDTPAAVIARGTRPDSQTAVGCLKDLQVLAERVGDGPALLVIGNAVARSDIWSETFRAVEAPREAVA